MDFGLFVYELRVGGNKYGERLTCDGFLIGMENGVIHEQARNEEEKENVYGGYKWMKCEGIGVSHVMKT